MYLNLIISLLLTFLSALARPDFRPSSLEACPGRDIAPPKNEHGKAPKNGITGDTLSVTRCYCEAPTYDRWGYYMQANYTNYHTGHAYLAQFLCNDDARIEHNVPKCWDAHERENEELCADDDADNEFCYTITYAHNSKTLRIEDLLRPLDTYHFNGQSRNIASQPPNARPAPDECNEHCYYWLDGMNMARDGGDDGYRKTLDLPHRSRPKVCNHKEVFTDLDDMCWRCE